MSDRHSFSSDNFYVGSDNVQCPNVILSTGSMPLYDPLHIVGRSVNTGRKHWQTKEPISKPEIVHVYSKF